MKKASIYIRKKADRLFRAMFLGVTGHLLLLTSAICEKGETELSKTLIPSVSQIDGMIEAIVAAAVVLIVGRAVLAIIVLNGEKSDSYR